MALGLLVGAATAQSQADDLAVPLALQFSETLTHPPAMSPGSPPATTTPGTRKVVRRKLGLTPSLAAWSGTRRNDGTDAVLVPRLQLEASASGAGFSSTLMVDAIREQTKVPASRSRTQLTLREAWVGWKHDGSQARIGWQIINWGRTDVLNPTDNVAARTYTRLVDRDADQKLGVPMLSLHQRLGTGSNVLLLWQPLFRATQVPLPPQPGARYVDDRPEASPSAAGLKLETTGERASAAISYFRGPAKLPNLALQPTDVANGTLGLNHPQADTIGLDGEFVAGPWVLRGESAWTRVRGSGRTLIGSRESALDTVIGIERAFGAASAFLQAEWKWIPGWIDPQTAPAPLQPLALANARFDDELHRHRGQLGTGFALNTSDLRWAVSFDAAWAPADSDWALRPRLRWRYDDRIQFFAGGDWFGGPQRGVYGRLRSSSAVFVGLSAGWALPSPRMRAG